MVREDRARQSRQRTRWKDELDSFAEVVWNRRAADIYEWRRLRGLFPAVNLKGLLVMLTLICGAVVYPSVT